MNEIQLDMPTVSEPAGDGIKAREIVLNLVEAVLRRHRTLDEALLANPGFDRLETRDKAFVRMLTATVFRRLHQIDDMIATALDIEMDRVTPRIVLDVLRIGTAQLAFLGTPAHAAVDTSVRLAESCGLMRQKSLVNAVLRRLSHEAPKLMQAQDPARLNTPDWLWQTWIKDYGVQTALQIAEANLSEATQDFTIKEDPEYWARQLDARILPTGSLRRLQGGNVRDLPGFSRGEWWIQDAAAAVPARLFGDLKGKTVVDLCAAPGGKTAQLASAGGQVMAVDRAARRMERLRENLERLKITDSVEVVIADGTVWQPPEPVDAVLVDAPCTATGTIRRHPDLLHLKSHEDLARLAEVQNKLLHNAVKMLKPGGILVYCTCSLQYEEGEHQIHRLLQTPGNVMESLPITAEELGGVENMINEEGEFRSLPFHLAAAGGIDGFFAARLVKKS